ncbi:MULTISPECIES: helix-turn-helix transcriptional regulator [Pontibacillus]|uniref:Helix-turn-helix domain-containing protein n=1 Tax=Pontibacillus chungwhensis TaxID=265426 RepID=A0ABY8UV70_9BACI|nr:MULTISPECIES: helix-turn-helix domain-containing protein [Pontibacillus]MCD5323558.1 helix-turn-helix domain-containing protein [Pontibacillus sp. HN14]WIF96927.1 helix-turn-helix domain-containing protein [Pontibacillus chungwhensis]
MDHTLKVTNVLADATRYSIYQFITKHNQAVSVTDIASEFGIHPNVARLHLTKLEDVQLLVSSTQKTGKGGRPSRLYHLSENDVSLQFPYRDYHLLARIALESLMELGMEGERVLYSTGFKYGKSLFKQSFGNQNPERLSIEEKISWLQDSAIIIGMFPNFEYVKHKETIFFSLSNCPFKDLAKENPQLVCTMHGFFLEGMMRALFTNIHLKEVHNMMEGCATCSYKAAL